MIPQSPRISVIIPVYNAEKYIAQCLESVINQTFGDFEAIIVDDGSTDDSATICRKYATQDYRLKFISKPNGGVSSARNVALSHASGCWVTFLDADDMLYPHCMEQCIGILESKELDLLQFSLSRVYDSGAEHEPIGNVRVYNSSQFFGIRHNVSAGASFIKLSTIKDNGIKFNETIKLAEDQLFILDVIRHSERLSIIPSMLYYYRVNENSATYSWKDEDIFQTCRVLYGEKMKHHEYAHQVDNTILNLVTNVVVHSRNRDNIEQIVQIYKQADIKYCDRVCCAAKCFYRIAQINVQLAVSLIRLYFKKHL